MWDFCWFYRLVEHLAQFGLQHVLVGQWCTSLTVAREKEFSTIWIDLQGLEFKAVAVFDDI